MKVQAIAPGRVNLIGEHTDYNEGFVLPIAINRKVNMTAFPREDKVIKIIANDLGETKELTFNDLIPLTENKWWSYIAGVFWVLLQEGFKLEGANIEFSGDIPIGAGLSSSAALELATAAALTTLNHIEINLEKLALLCQKAENDYIGVRCGIMDQFASALSLQDHALFIDCKTLDYKHIPLNMNEYVFGVIDSKVRRKLSHSEYNRRREECGEALDIINEVTGTKKKSLREVSFNELEKSSSFLTPNLYNRSYFVLKENRRVLKALDAINGKDFYTFGNLMNASHHGLRDLYEVSCKELDLIVEASQEVEGVMGARMTGAGFGGCVIALLSSDAVEKFHQEVEEKIKDFLPEIPSFYITPAVGGLQITNL